MALYVIKLTKGQNKRSLSEMDISVDAALENISEFTEDVLAKTKSILGSYLSTAFGSVKMKKNRIKKILRPRTCVQPELKFNTQNELLINCIEKTVAVSQKSDQGQACVNTVEAVYLASVLFSIFTGIGIVPD